MPFEGEDPEELKGEEEKKRKKDEEEEEEDDDNDDDDDDDGSGPEYTYPYIVVPPRKRARYT
jgi:hypothetical protein